MPKGSLVTVNTCAIHHDERFFPDPGRFASGWEDRIPRYAWLPLGGGRRVRIGSGFSLMEARPILATVAQRFRLSLESPKETPPVQLVTLRPRDPVPMRLRKRERNSCLNGGLVEVMRRRQAAPRYRTELLRKA